MKLLREDVNVKIDYEDLESFDRANKFQGLPYSQRYEGLVISDELANAIKTANAAIKKAYQLYYNEIQKPIDDEKERKEQERLDRTSLKINLTPAQADLIDSVLGQLSDGYWENSRAAEKYWKYIHLRDNDLIVDLDKLRYASYSDSWHREFNNVWQNPDEVKKWFARKAQIVHNLDMRDTFNTLKIAEEQLDRTARYLDRGVNQTYRQIQNAINSLK